MLIKKPVGKSKVYDILHKVGVNTCIVVTGVALAGLGFIGYDFYDLYRKSKNVKKLKSDEILESDKVVENL